MEGVAQLVGSGTSIEWTGKRNSCSGNVVTIVDVFFKQRSRKRGAGGMRGRSKRGAGEMGGLVRSLHPDAVLDVASARQLVVRSRSNIVTSGSR